MSQNGYGQDGAAELRHAGQWFLLETWYGFISAAELRHAVAVVSSGNMVSPSLGDGGECQRLVHDAEADGSWQGRPGVACGRTAVRDGAPNEQHQQVAQMQQWQQPVAGISLELAEWRQKSEEDMIEYLMRFTKKELCKLLGLKNSPKWKESLAREVMAKLRGPERADRNCGSEGSAELGDGIELESNERRKGENIASKTSQ